MRDVVLCDTVPSSDKALEERQCQGNFFYFAFPIGKAKWGDSKPYICAKKRKSSRLIKSALPESTLAFFSKLCKIRRKHFKINKSGEW